MQKSLDAVCMVISQFIIKYLVGVFSDEQRVLCGDESNIVRLRDAIVVTGVALDGVGGCTAHFSSHVVGIVAWVYINVVDAACGEVGSRCAI